MSSAGRGNGTSMVTTAKVRKRRFGIFLYFGFYDGMIPTRNSDKENAEYVTFCSDV
ncbi:hypothetical protein COCC4DRAFT_29296 [Bipolaris maydis ATCC 48331]|uniref:Uncharacterized protein n=2 Tax=Cochliobolus heterostrophus TaxID=5016 RepID=M2TDR4_COCH5|nr:uncharacterized protein COCC4DRAFT_29296 [Bipolaris maydis ATCC 48331]EMD95615.1 hypothetical protein COCHEDRAFT_1019307 [Bipolaris maydis C5]ENI10476.1 hypothetical protein COCC4DRAFT_29296 [Bipolaris maydis ATCC 48331]